MAESCFIIYTYRTFFIQSSIEKHFSCFHVLASMNNASMNIGGNISLQIFSVLGFFFGGGGKYPKEELLGHMETAFLIV